MAKYYFYIFLSIVLLAALILCLIVSYWFRYWYKKNLEMWSQRALELGIDYESKNLDGDYLVGDYRGMNYWIYGGISYMHERKCDPRIEMNIDNPYQVKISFQKKAIIHLILDQFGSRGDEIGHAEFDESFYLRSEPMNLVPRILKSSELPSRLVDLNRKYPLRFKLSGDICYIEVKGFEYSMECLKPFLDITYDFKQSVEQAISYYPSF